MRISCDDLRHASIAILQAAGVDDEQTRSVTEILLWCDMVGRRNHGTERLPILVKRAQAGLIQCPASPQFEALSPSIERLNADNGFGHHAGRLAIDRACELATATGVGIVGVRKSNFFGAGAYYVNRAAEAGMISLAFSNSFPKVAAAGGLLPVLGTNPFAFGAPRRAGNAILVDMSTAAMAGSSVREAMSTGKDIEAGMAIDTAGKPIRDPAKVAQGTLLPAAGAKGYGLAIVVEMLSAVLTGSGIAQQVNSMYQNFEQGGENGQFFLAIDIARWMPLHAYYARVEILTAMLVNSAIDGRVRLPGDDRWMHYSKSLTSGVHLDDRTRERLEKLATELSVSLPWA